jgi:hypothetical protein
MFDGKLTKAMVIHPKLIDRVNTILLKISTTFYCRIDKVILKFTQKFKESLLLQVKIILKITKLEQSYFVVSKLSMKHWIETQINGLEVGVDK